MGNISFLEMARKRSYEYVAYSSFPHVMKDLQYGDNPRECLDIFLPSSPGPFPVILQVTGGGWVYGDKSMKKMENTFHFILERGYALVSMNYSLSDNEKYPVPIWQVKRAIRYLRENHEKLKLDTDNLFLYGNSAGGYLVLMAALTGETPPFDTVSSKGRSGSKNTSSSVSGVVSIYGFTDFLSNNAKFKALGLKPKYEENYPNSPSAFFLGKDPEKNLSLAKQASVLSYVDASHPPILIQHGLDDHTVSPMHSFELAKALYSVKGAKVEVDYFPSLDHSDPYFKSKENTDRIIDFFDSVRYQS